MILLYFISGKAFANASIECNVNRASMRANTASAIAVGVIAASQLYIKNFALRRKNVYRVQITLY